jgi:hypothetical protein
VVQTFWVAVGIVYALLAIAEWYFVSRIETINLPTIKKYSAGTQEEFDKFLKQLRGTGNPAQDAYTHQVIIDWAQWLNFNNAVDGIETVAKNFNTAAKANRKILYLAAVSFVVAAVISFAQGVALK